MRDITTASGASAPSTSRDRGDGSRMVGAVLLGTSASLPLALIVLASGHGVLAALLAYSFGGSLLAGLAGLAVHARESGVLGRVRRRLRVTPHGHIA
jgi:hypothetical protein